ncbi:TetR/AcrR family transcriptional regulator [Flavobacterium sp. SUN052]|uniref:TetR/AcrR family transcriptional regulator n=1 Tax=Flavobacterium sp. SUN052 TaxID=3002441 RepID=UPI00237ECD79|nr:TetR/AcrR family transcriptional regulator [Flavobacterium sp. SUN052]MEC4004933.1 TetR/AcrR family transcriptional regulator [Flavobacterium sp. SUN052]
MEFNDKQIEILQVSEKLFAEEGFDGTSVREIAKLANINVAMISYYFGSKEKLLESIVLYRIGSMGLRLENLLNENISPVVKIEKIIEFYIIQVNKNRHIHQIVNNEISNKKREINFQSFTELKKNNLKLVQSIVKEGQEKGLFKTDVNVALFSPLIIGSLIYFHMNKVLYGDLFNLKTDEEFDNYIKNEFTQHIQKTIKALLTYEN